jgi:hypothetical protein
MTAKRCLIRQKFTLKSSKDRGFPITVNTGEVYDLTQGPQGLQIRYGSTNFPIIPEEFQFIEFL